MYATRNPYQQSEPDTVLGARAGIDSFAPAVNVARGDGLGFREICVGAPGSDDKASILSVVVPSTCLALVPRRAWTARWLEA